MAEEQQDEIALVQAEIARAVEALAKVTRERRETNRDSPLLESLNAAITEAKTAISAAEIKLRRLYEAKDDGDYSLSGKPR